MPGDGELHEHYSRGEERDRLLSPFGQVEYARTCELIERHLPPPPAVVADIGRGPGRYTLWLAERGYAVHHRDLVDLHLEQLAADAAAHGLEIDSAVGDARDLDLPDAAVDAVLLLGPLYHLGDRDDRVGALREARRIVRPDGLVRPSALSPRRSNAPGGCRRSVQRVLPSSATAPRRGRGRRARVR